MPKAARVMDTTAHGVPMQGSGSPDVFIGNMKAWRAMPAGVGAGLDQASKDTKAIMDVKPTPVEAFIFMQVKPKVAKIQAAMEKVAGQVESETKKPGACASVKAAFVTLEAAGVALDVVYQTASKAPAPGAEPAARAAFTIGYQKALAAAMSASTASLAGPWDMHTCAAPGPNPHGPGFVMKGCQTVFINNLPAAMEGQELMEAAGGPNAIKIGCGTVFIGDKAPSSGGGGAAASPAAAGSPAAAASKPPASPPPEKDSRPNEAPAGAAEMSTLPPAKTPEPMMSPDVCGLSELPDIGVRTILKRCSGGGYTWTSKYDIELRGGILVVTVRIKLNNRTGPLPSGEAALPPVGSPLGSAAKASIKSDIEEKLSGKAYIHRDKCKKGKSCPCPETGCCKIPIKVVVKLVEAGFHHEVDLFPGTGQAFADRWFQIKKRANTYAHETGHMLGFYDEYADGAVGAPPRWKVQANVLMSKGLIVPGEYFWEFRDWLKRKLGEELTVVAFESCRR